MVEVRLRERSHNTMTSVDLRSGSDVTHLLLLLTPVELLAHDANDLGQRLFGGVNVDKRDARASCDDVERSARVLLHTVLDLGREKTLTAHTLK